MSKTYDQDGTDGSLTAYAQYLHQVRWTPKLTLEEEKHLFLCLERGKVERSQPWPDAAVLADARQARDRLVQGYQPLVIHLARRFMREHRGDSMDIMDFIQEANLALLSAVEDNDGTCHDRLKPLAIVCICYRLRRVLATTGMMFRLPENKLHEIRGVRRAHSQLRGALGREPLVAEIAAHLRLDEKTVTTLMVAVSPSGRWWSGGCLCSRRVSERCLCSVTGWMAAGGAPIPRWRPRLISRSRRSAPIWRG